MISRKTLARFIRGWLPEETNLTSFQRITRREMYTAAAIGIGVSLALCYSLLAGLHFLGWYNNMDSVLELIVFMVVFFPCYLIGQFVAKHLEKRWSGS